MTQGNHGSTTSVAAGAAPGTRYRSAGTRSFGLLSLLMLAAILYAGLRPFRSLQNQVSWTPNSHSLRFGEYGTAVSLDPISPPGAGGQRSLEIWVQPRWFDDRKTFLAFYDPAQPRQLWLRQFHRDLELRLAPSSAWGRAPVSRLFVQDVFSRGKTVFLAITSSASGTIVYEDGVMAREAPDFRMSGQEFSGRLILGTAPIFSQSWPGVVRGLAIYDHALTAAQIARHYETWTKEGRPQLTPEEQNIALYLFDEGVGRTIHNRRGSGHDLFIPEKYVLVNQTILDPIWRAANGSRQFWKDGLINVLGFAPLGFFLCGYLAARGTNRPALLATVIGAAVSLLIEIAQTHLPMRDSSMSDVISNFLGSGMGALTYRAIHAMVRDRLLP
jgi:VanZ family protein